MARRSRMSMLKRQRELRKAEKAARKRARRHGVQIEGFVEPTPTVGAAEILGGAAASESTADDSERSNEESE